jgi:hypothetical protein
MHTQRTRVLGIHRSVQTCQAEDRRWEGSIAPKLLQWDEEAVTSYVTEMQNVVLKNLRVCNGRWMQSARIIITQSLHAVKSEYQNNARCIRTTYMNARLVIAYACPAYKKKHFCFHTRSLCLHNSKRLFSRISDCSWRCCKTCSELTPGIDVIQHQFLHIAVLPNLRTRHVNASSVTAAWNIHRAMPFTQKKYACHAHMHILNTTLHKHASQANQANITRKKISVTLSQCCKACPTIVMLQSLHITCLYACKHSLAR